MTKKNQNELAVISGTDSMPFNAVAAVSNAFSSIISADDGKSSTYMHVLENPETSEADKRAAERICMIHDAEQSVIKFTAVLFTGAIMLYALKKCE